MYVLSCYRCIEEWTTKANRCPVCNTSIVDPQRLEKARIAIINGETPPPITSPLPADRQRRHRTRRQDGTFELRDGPPPPDDDDTGDDDDDADDDDDTGDDGEDGNGDDGDAANQRWISNSEGREEVVPTAR